MRNWEEKDLKYIHNSTYFPNCIECANDPYSIEENSIFISLNVNGKRLNSYIITDRYVQFSFEIETLPKKEGNKVLGIDTGINALASLSSGHKKDKLGLDERTYSCSSCGMNIDRDLNAAKNLEQLYTSSSGGIYAFGDGSSCDSLANQVSPSLN